MLFLANIVFAITTVEYHRQSKLERKLPVNKDKKGLLLDKEPVGCISPSQSLLGASVPLRACWVHQALSEPVGCISPSQSLIRVHSPKANQRAERLLRIGL